jgi:thioredoxin 1
MFGEKDPTVTTRPLSLLRAAAFAVSLMAPISAQAQPSRLTAPRPALEAVTPAEQVTPATVDRLVIDRSRRIPVIADFYADWCAPCLVLSPRLETAVRQERGRVALVRVDLEKRENRPLAERYGVRAIPHVHLFRDGDSVAEFVGGNFTVDEIRKFIRYNTQNSISQDSAE